MSRPVLIGLAFTVFCGLASLAHSQIPVFDSSRFTSLLAMNSLLGDITRKMDGGGQDSVSKIEADKAALQGKISAQMGAPTTVNLAPGGVSTNTEDYRTYVLTRDLNPPAKASDPTLVSYLQWDERRRLSEKAMDHQLATLLKERNGARLDWTGHLQLASATHTLTNTRLADSIVTANAINERRIKDKQTAAKLFRQELDEDLRNAAEARLNSR